MSQPPAAPAADPAAPEPADLLIEAGFLYPVAEGGTDDGAETVVTGAEIAIRDGRILHAGPARPPGSWAPRERLGGPGLAALPGFVNSHCHTASTVFRSQTDDGAGGGALYGVAFRGESRVDPEDWRRLARLGVAEMILAGYTTLNDFWYCPDAMGELGLETGLRLQLACEIVDVDKTRLAEGDYARDARRGERLLREGAEVAARWHGAGEGLISARIGPHGADTCAAGLHLEAKAEARRLGVGMHCHVAQSKAEAEAIRAWHGLGPAAWLAEIGALDPSWVLAHLTFAEADDIAAVARTGAAYAHCASIYPRRGVYPDLAAIRAAGVRTGLASDWMMNDPFEGMRCALNALRLREGRHDALTSAQALEMATADAAEALGLGARIGRLAPGREADLVLVDVERPHLQPFYATPASLVYYARAGDVRHSVVRGRVVMRDREIPGLDLPEAVAEVRARAPHLGAQMRALGGDARLPACPCGMH